MAIYITVAIIYTIIYYAIVEHGFRLSTKVWIYLGGLVGVLVVTNVALRINARRKKRTGKS